jgi:hypothetical protein
MHRSVSGELACGNFRNRTERVKHLNTLPSAVTATDYEVMRLIEDRMLWGHGIGWIDAHL